MIARVDTTGATTETDELLPCGGIASTVWYKWNTPSVAGTAVWETYGSDYDTVLAIYAGGTLPTLMAQACNDDHPASGGGSLSTRSTIAFAFAASSTYYIQVGGFLGAQGNLVLNYVRGGAIMVGSPADSDVRDGVLTLREAMMVVNGTYNHCAGLTAAESAHILDCPTAGIGPSLDVIHFNPVTFPVGSPATISLALTLPFMSDGDRIDGVGSGVVIDGQTQSFDCLVLSGGHNQVAGLRIRRCGNGVLVSASSNRVGGFSPAERNVITENVTGARFNGGSSSDVLTNYIGVGPDGATPAPNTDGVVADNAEFNFVDSNVISGNSQTGVSILGSGSDSVFVIGNYIGTDATGTLDRGNGTYGVLVVDGNRNSIGFSNSSNRNVISGNNLGGVFIYPTVPGSGDALGNSVINNYIGTNAAGTAAIPNGTAGVTLYYAPGNIVGTPYGNDANLISGNTIGISITGPYAGGNLVQNNKIGTNAAGTAAIPNTQHGILLTSQATSNLIGGTTAGERNVISGNGVDGVRIDSAGGGTVPYVSGYPEIPKPLADNATTTSVIQAPAAAKILDVNVTIDITHTFDSDLNISLMSPAGTTVNLSNHNGGGADNYTNTTFDDEAFTDITAGFPPYNGLFRPQQPLFNFDGQPAAGTWTLIVTDDAPFDTGTLNAWSLSLYTDGNQVSGNYIGTNAAGSGAVANGGNGVSLDGSPSNTIGGAASGSGNVISANTGSGVLSTGDLNTVAGNLIGTAADGTSPLGNTSGGVAVSQNVSSNQVGGTLAGMPNTIAYNGGPGVTIGAAGQPAGILVEQNAIYRNAGLGIDLSNDGVTVNDSGDFDGGPNDLLNFPVLTGVIAGGGNTQVDWTLNSTPKATFSFEFFDNTACDPTGFGEGETFLGSSEQAMGFGTTAFTATFSGQAADGHFITGTATRVGAIGTSEFSTCAPVVDDADDDNDGVSDVAETPCGANKWDPNSRPERTDTQADDDGDGLINEPLPQGSDAYDCDGDGAIGTVEIALLTDPQNPDTDVDTASDGSDNCPRWPNPTQTLPAWPVPAGDSDCDGFTNAAEGTLTTDPIDQCPDNIADDAWPPDISKNGSVSVTDVLFLKDYFNQSVPPSPARYDIVPSGAVNITDVVEFKKYFGLGCT